MLRPSDDVSKDWLTLRKPPPMFSSLLARERAARSKSLILDGVRGEVFDFDLRIINFLMM
jgi:hypothetical protein